MPNAEPSVSTRDRLIAATIDLIRQKGFEATRVDDICTSAGVSKGAFFHHFASKAEIAIAAAQAWGHGANCMFAAALAAHDDPRDFILAYLDMRIELLTGAPFSYMCYAGTLVEEVWQTHPDVMAAAAGSVNCHIDWLVPKFETALGSPGRALELATLCQASVQGALIIAKTDANVARAKACLRHVKTYVEAELRRT